MAKGGRKLPGPQSKGQEHVQARRHTAALSDLHSTRRNIMVRRGHFAPYVMKAMLAHDRNVVVCVICLRTAASFAGPHVAG
jgi:hypothetical protein